MPSLIFDLQILNTLTPPKPICHHDQFPYKGLSQLSRLWLRFFTLRLVCSSQGITHLGCSSPWYCRHCHKGTAGIWNIWLAAIWTSSSVTIDRHRLNISTTSPWPSHVLQRCGVTFVIFEHFAGWGGTKIRDDSQNSQQLYLGSKCWLGSRDHHTKSSAKLRLAA